MAPRRLAAPLLAAVTLAASLVATVPQPATAAATALAAPYTWTPSTANRYAVVHGCFNLRTGPGAYLGGTAGPYRMQATALGQYLLYTPTGTYLGDGTAGVAPSATPSAATVWQVDGTKLSGYTVTNLATGRKVPVAFAAATGCADYPEAQVGAAGRTFKGTSATGPVTGTVEAHVHVTAFEFLGGDFHCGRPWHPYGVTYALPDCAPYEQGTNGAVESFLDYGTPVHPHDTRGWPTFAEWPSPTALAEEGIYWTGIERAWLAGLRVMKINLVDNEALCMVMTKKHNPCNDMKSVEIQAKDVHALQDYIDAQAGGPGRGFFRIVTTPAQARQVINAGKLAVLLGIEVSDIFNCGVLLNVPKCTTLQIDGWLTRLQQLGVTSFFPIHKFDNAFGGTKMDAAALGTIINVGNFYETGHFWNVQTCTGDEHDNTQYEGVPVLGDLTGLLNGALSPLLGGALLPVYPPAPHCNARGLTPLGSYLIKQMIKRHFLVELDHMDARTGDQVLSLLEAAHYSGVITSHSWDSPEQTARIYALGGYAAPYAGSADTFVQDWQQYRAMHAANAAQYPFGIGFGSDMNGVGAQGGPTSAHPISYPFTSAAGAVTFDREVWGQRTFDINTDGVANYGLYADWLQALRVRAGPAITADLFQGAEAYLQMWQRAAAH